MGVTFYVNPCNNKKQWSNLELQHSKSWVNLKSIYELNIHKSAFVLKSYCFLQILTNTAGSVTFFMLESRLEH